MVNNFKERPKSKLETNWKTKNIILPIKKYRCNVFKFKRLVLCERDIKNKIKKDINKISFWVDIFA